MKKNKIFTYIRSTNTDIFPDPSTLTITFPSPTINAALHRIKLFDNKLNSPDGKIFDRYLFDENDIKIKIQCSITVKPRIKKSGGKGSWKKSTAVY